MKKIIKFKKIVDWEIDQPSKQLQVYFVFNTLLSIFFLFKYDLIWPILIMNTIPFGLALLVSIKKKVHYVEAN